MVSISKLVMRITKSSFSLQRTTDVAYNVIFQNVNAFQTWHDRFGHPGIGMMRKIITNSVGHNLSNTKLPQSSDYVCTACGTGKLILRPSYLKIQAKLLKFLERIQGDICGPIQPLFDHSGILWF
jgi:hypothetical protein